MNHQLPTVLVLGASGDIGVAISERFRDAGHQVIGTSSVEFDLSDNASIRRWFARPRPSFGVLVHSAGRNFPADFETLSDDELQACMSVNVIGFVEVVRQLRSELIAQGGRVVAISSIFGSVSRRGRLAYAMSKHALIGVVRTLALELGPHGVLVNAVSPGYIDTRLTRQNNDATTIARLEAAVPSRRLGDVSDVADAVYFLGSSANRYINGHDLIVDGGFTLDGGRG